MYTILNSEQPNTFQSQYIDYLHWSGLKNHKITTYSQTVIFGSTTGFSIQRHWKRFISDLPSPLYVQIDYTQHNMQASRLKLQAIHYHTYKHQSDHHFYSTYHLCINSLLCITCITRSSFVDKSEKSLTTGIQSELNHRDFYDYSTLPPRPKLPRLKRRIYWPSDPSLRPWQNLPHSCTSHLQS